MGHSRVNPDCRVTTSGNGSPRSATTRPVTVRAPATDTCWPMMVRTRSWVGSMLPGSRSPGRAASSGASIGSAARARSAGPSSRSSASSRVNRASTWSGTVAARSGSPIRPVTPPGAAHSSATAHGADIALTVHR